MNNEILSKARQLAQIKNEPEGSCDISKLSVALEMADWMKETMIEKAVQYLQSVPHSKPMFWSIDDFRKKMEE